MTHTKLAIVACQAVPTLSFGEQRLPPVLAQRGIAVDICIWDDPAIRWQDYDVILIRCAWDYHHKLPTFLAWLDMLEAKKMKVINDIATLRWNLDKAYLLELAQANLAVIPTQRIQSTDHRPLAELIDAMQSDQIVLKPTQSAGAWRTFRVGHETAHQVQADFAQWRLQQDFLLQPFMPEIVSDGEWSLIFFGGKYSHTLLKQVRSGDFRVQSEHGGSVQRIDAPTSICAQAATFLQALPSLPCYARVDGIVRAGQFMLMELELLEPELFLDFEPLAAQRFADAIEAALS